MKRQVRRPATAQSALPALHWWDRLHFRLALAINLIAIGVLGAFWVIDYRREQRVHFHVEIARLLEEAKVLRVARQRFERAEDFQGFLDTFCRQMGVAASPGHHIAVFDASEVVIARAHERANPLLEAKMLAESGPSGVFSFNGEKYLSAQVAGANGTRIVVAQSSAPIESIIRAQAVSRAASLGILATLVFGVTTLVVLKWVRDPLRELTGGIHAVADGRFDVRVRPSGSAEFRYLADGVNEMAGALQKVEKHRKSQMARARDIQRRLLPSNGRSANGLEVVAAFQPADSVGGDFYDVLSLSDGSVLLVVLDVSGHGVASALYTALLRAILRHVAKLTPDPARIATAMNDEFAGVVGDSGDFATCFLVRFAQDSEEIEYVSAGHDAAVIVRREGQVDILAGHDLPLGVERSETFTASRAELGAGDRLFLYTDGLHEAAVAEGREFGRERLNELLAKTSGRAPATQLDDVIQNVRSHAIDDGFQDDVTLLCARRQ